MTRALSRSSPSRTVHKSVSHAKVTEDDNTPDDDEQEEPTAFSSGDDVPAGPAPLDALSEMLASLQGVVSSRITVYRVVKNQPQSYVFECDPASFSLDDLRDKHRGGEFRLYVTKDGRLFKNMRVVVEPKQAEPSVAHSNAGLSDVLAVMRDGFSSQAAAIREAMAVSRSPASPFSMMDIPAVITAIAGAVTALRPPPSPVPPESTSKAIDMFMQGLQLARELRDDAGPQDNSIGGMLRDVLKSPLMAAAVQNALPAAAPIPPATAPPALPRPNPTPAPSHRQESEPPMLSTALRDHYFSMLCQKAAEGSDPALYADIILDNLPDDALSVLLTRAPSPLEALISDYPPIAQYRDWFARLIAYLLDASTEEAGPEPSVPHINGAVENAIDNTAPFVPGQSS